MQCPSCQTDNPSANRFCDQCGAPLEARCPQCAAVLRAGARFCGACGHRVAAAEASPPAATAAPPSARPIASYTPKHLADKVLKARSAIEGERRQVTVLFADIAGFTSLAEGRDPEEVHQIVDRCFDAITAEVHRFEGTINQYTGDGVMALFGAPIAHEDSARRAAHAALGIQRAIRDLSREIEARQGPAIRMRIGLNTGPVVVGRIGNDLRMDYTAVGDTTNVAARLQQAARPGSVLVSESTLRAIFAQGEAWDKAFAYLIRSGDKARDTYANEAALAHYTRAIEVASRVTPELPLAAVLEVYQRRSRLQVVVANNDEAIAGLEKMLALARAAGDRRLEGEALADLAFAHAYTLSWEHQPEAARYADEAAAVGREIGDDRILTKALATRGTVHAAYGEIDDGTRMIEEAVRVGEPLGAPDLYLHGLFFLGHFHNWRGEFHQAIDVQRRVTREAETIHDEFNEGLGLWSLGLSHIGCGLYAEARAVLDDGLAKARERKSHYNVGRITNSLGWLHQEFGDFRRALELDREAAELGRHHKIGNVEISSLINIGADLVPVGEPGQALAVLESMVERVEKGLGSHRWRWDMRVSVGIAEALLAVGRGDEVLAWIERAASTARTTGSAKYLGKCHVLRGELAILGRRWDDAVTELGQALAIGRRIEYPTLTWQAAHLLARAQAAAGKLDEAAGTARVALETLDLVAARAPEPALRRTFTEWARVQTAREDLERILR